MSNLPTALQITQRRTHRQSQVASGQPLSLWNDAHARAVTTLIPNPALLPAIRRSTDAQDEDGVFFTTPGWDD